uniref:Uncharacterized protein n=1 Tax=Timema tahoe TaxID=61484 RepID=A0A7R9ICZ3_9NEOP|nr:unnamed protein product [Timema tahoe]
MIREHSWCAVEVFGQVTLTFRYGREDEEVMGLKFCNEAVMCLAQLYPCHERAVPEPNTPLQVSQQLQAYMVGCKGWGWGWGGPKLSKMDSYIDGKGSISWYILDVVVNHGVDYRKGWKRYATPGDELPQDTNECGWVYRDEGESVYNIGETSGDGKRAIGCSGVKSGRVGESIDPHPGVTSRTRRAECVFTAT